MSRSATPRPVSRIGVQRSSSVVVLKRRLPRSSARCKRTITFEEFLAKVAIWSSVPAHPRPLLGNSPRNTRNGRAHRVKPDWREYVITSVQHPSSVDNLLDAGKALPRTGVNDHHHRKPLCNACVPVEFWRNIVDQIVVLSLQTCFINYHGVVVSACPKQESYRWHA